MNQLNSTESGNHTILQLLRLLEVNKVGGLGGFDWKAMLRFLKEKGTTLLFDERAKIKETLKEVSRQVKALQDEGISKQTLKGRVQKVVKNIVEEKMGINVTDFYVRKAILIDEAYDDEDIGIFLSQGLQSDVRVLHGFLKNKSARRGINIAPEYFDDYDDFIDPIYLFLLLDFISDGILDFNFVGECIGAEEDFLTSDEYQEAELAPVEVAEPVETSTVDDSPPDRNVGVERNYEPDSGGNFDDGGSDDGGDCGD